MKSLSDKARILLLGAALPLLLFQNCTPNTAVFSGHELTLGNSSPSSVSSGGNGDPYDGKPDPGLYVRMIPDYRCGTERAFFGELVIDADKVQMKTLNTADCSSIEKTIDLKEIEMSGYNRLQVGWGEGVYEKKALRPELTQANEPLIEVWCRSLDSNAKTGLDVTVQIHPTTRATSARVLHSEDQSGVISVQEKAGLTLLRQLRASAATYQGESFELNVDLEGLKAGAVKVPARFKGAVGGLALDQDLQCRTAGMLDQSAPVQPMSCPVGSIKIAAAPPYSESDFCTAKYEAKDDGGKPAFTAAKIPWVNISQNESKAQCSSLGAGYELMSNAEWQTIAHEIELIGANWSSGQVGVGFLNYGHSDGAPQTPCDALVENVEGATCADAGVGHEQKRTHLLKNGEKLWDLAGNVSEWLKDVNAVGYGDPAMASQVTNSGTFINAPKTTFGPLGDYSALNSGAYGGLGYMGISADWGVVLRGGDFNFIFNKSGIFATELGYIETQKKIESGFRCVYHP